MGPSPAGGSRITMSRRVLLSGLSASFSSMLLSRRAHGARKAPALVFLVLRGGMDGLSAVVPIDEPRYYELRPQIAIPPPNGFTAGKESERALPLVSGLGLHPALADILPAFRAGDLAIVTAVGIPGGSRSHFQAQDTLDTAFIGEPPEMGWMGRLTSVAGPSRSLLERLSMGIQIGRALQGAPGAVSLGDLEAFDFAIRNDVRPHLQALLERNYAGASGLAAEAGRRALQIIQHLRDLRARVPGRASEYPRSLRGLSEVARLIRGNVGLRMATVDLGGWDTHALQGGVRGVMAVRLSQLAQGLSAFRADLGDHQENVVLLVATEFGRTVAQNGTQGTDHGRASLMFVMGGGVRGGRVFGRFPGLAEHQLEDGRDLAVTTDFRLVLRDVAERLLEKPLEADEFETVFPGCVSTERLGLFA